MASNNLNFLLRAGKMRAQIELELVRLSNRALRLIDSVIVQPSSPSSYMSTENRVLYAKLKGDYLRYQAEAVQDVDARTFRELVIKTQRTYREAMADAEKELSPTHPVRLGLALNYSVFCYEVSIALFTLLLTVLFCYYNWIALGLFYRSLSDGQTSF